jgi:hypothetical protein
MLQRLVAAAPVSYFSVRQRPLSEVFRSVVTA